MDNNTALVLLAAILAFMIVGITWAAAYRDHGTKSAPPERPIDSGTFRWEKTTRAPLAGEKAAKKVEDDNADWKKPNRG